MEGLGAACGGGKEKIAKEQGCIEQRSSYGKHHSVNEELVVAEQELVVLG